MSGRARASMSRPAIVAACLALAAAWPWARAWAAPGDAALPDGGSGGDGRDASSSETGAGETGPDLAAADAGAAALLTPPVPIEMPVIAVPADAPPFTATVEVGVVITIDPQGAVTAAEVIQSAGPAFDRAVTEGVKRFRFQPARQQGVAIPVRVPFTQRFEPPPPPLSAVTPDLDAIIEGIVLTRGARTPVGGATLVASEADNGRQAVTVTDEHGVFKLPVRAGVALELRISAPEHEKFLQHETLAKNQRLRVKYLIERRSYGQYESFVRAETDRTEVSRTTLSGRELTRVPGTFGDPFRVINVLPGVSSVMSLLPLPIVRGSSPGNTGMLLDGVRLPLLFHLLAGPSVVHPEFIDHVDFYPGGFPVSYGGYTGGIVDGVTRAARPDERRIDLDINLTQAGLLLREPIERLGVTVTAAGRIGYPGILLGLLSPDVSLSYWDYQLRLDGARPGGRWSIFLYGAQDTLSRRPAPDQDLQTVAHFAFHRLDLRYQRGSDGSGELYRLVLGYDDSSLGTGAPAEIAGSGALGNGTKSINPQIRLRRAPAAWLDLTLGVESNLRTVSNPPSTPATPTAMDLSMILNQDGIFTASAAFAETVWKPTARLRLIPGLRADLYDERHGDSSVTKSSWDPRLLARYHLTDADRGNVWLKGVLGR